MKSLSAVDSDSLKEELRCAISTNTIISPAFLQCGHGFESESLKTHMEKRNTCPLCRTEFKPGDEFQIPLLSKLLSILSRQIIGLSEPQVIKLRNEINCVTSGTYTYEWIENKLDILFRFPVLINEIDELNVALALDVAKFMNGFFKRYPHIRQAINKEAFNAISKNENIAEISLAYRFALSPQEFDSDPYLIDLFESHSLSHELQDNLLTRGRDNIGALALHLLLSTENGRHIFNTSESLRNKITRYALNRTPKKGKYQNISPLFLMTIYPDTRMTLHKDKSLQKKIGRALNANSGKARNLPNRKFEHTSPLFWITYNDPVECNQFNLVDILDNDDVRTEIIEAGMNNVISHLQLKDVCPALNLLTTPFGRKKLAKYPDLAELISPEILTRPFDQEILNGSIPLHILATEIELLSNSMLLQQKIDLYGLLCCANASTNFNYDSPLHILLSSSKSLELLLAIFKNNNELRQDFANRFKMPESDLTDLPFISILNILINLTKINFYDELIENRSSLQQSFISKFNNAAIIFILESLSKTKTLSVLQYEKIKKIILSNPEVLSYSLTSKIIFNDARGSVQILKSTFLASICRFTPIRELFLKNPVLLSRIHPPILNDPILDEDFKNTTGFSFLMSICSIKILGSEDCVSLNNPNFWQNVEVRTLYLHSACDYMRGQSPLSILVNQIGGKFILKNIKFLRDKIEVKDLFQYSITHGGILKNYFTYLINYDVGIELIQQKIDEDIKFCNDLKSTLTDGSLEVIKKIGIRFPEETSKRDNLSIQSPSINTVEQAFQNTGISHPVSDSKQEIAEQKMSSDDIGANRISTTFSSPISSLGDSYAAMCKKLKFSIGINSSEAKSFMEAIDEKKFSVALRRACTGKGELPFKLIKILFEYKEMFPFDLNEVSKTEGRSPLHYAAIANIKEVYDFLIANGANTELQDFKGHRASDYLRNRNLLLN